MYKQLHEDFSNWRTLKQKQAEEISENQMVLEKNVEIFTDEFNIIRLRAAKEIAKGEAMLLVGKVGVENDDSSSSICLPFITTSKSVQ